jgi:hypothetical protein
MQWRLAYKDDVKKLRAKLGSFVATISLLLMTQTVSSVTAAEHERDKTAGTLQESILAHRRLLENVKTDVGSSLAEHKETRSQLQSQGDSMKDLHLKSDRTSSQLEEENVLVQEIKSTTLITERTTRSLLSTATDTLTQATLSLLTLRDLAVQLSNLVASFTKFTLEMRESVGLLLRQFERMYKLLQSLEAGFTRKIYLPIVRFTDALGEEIALPYQVCRRRETFRMMVNTIFIDRPGKDRVAMDKFQIMHAQGGRLLQKKSWDHEVREGDHLQMSMELHEQDPQLAMRNYSFCPFPSCYSPLNNIEVTNGGKICPNCNRWSLMTREAYGDGLERFSSILKKNNSSENQSHEDLTDEPRHNDGSSVLSKAFESESGDIFEENIELYRNITLVVGVDDAVFGCWQEARRADKVITMISSLRTSLDPNQDREISSVMKEIESSSRLMRGLNDLLPHYQTRIPIVTY